MTLKNILRKFIVLNLLIVMLVSSAIPAFAASKKPKRVPMYTGSAWTDIIIDEMVKKAGLKSSMSDEEIVKKTYVYLAKHFKYASDTRSKKYYHKNPSNKKCKKYQAKIDKLKKVGKIKYNTQGCMLTTNQLTGKKEVVKWDNWRQHKGVCDDFAEIFALMCRRMGLKAGKTGGKILGVPHAWNYAYVNGKKYYFDTASASHVYLQNKDYIYLFYKMKKKDMDNYEFAKGEK